VLSCFRWLVGVAGVAGISSVLTSAAIPDPVRLDTGLVSGITTSGGVRVFKGIPFAAPPVGPLRWKAPQPVTAWDGVRKADQFSSVCVQPSGGRARVNVSVDLADSPKPSEDCLYLNVWTAAAAPSERRPVMVWIFGGAYAEGAGSSPHNDGAALARKGVVPSSQRNPVTAPRATTR
jgi:para-nitrobenzyl esterase